MKNIKEIFRTKLIVTLVFGLLSVASVNANNAKTDADIDALMKRAPETLTLITKDLSQKLKSDLAENNLQIKLTNLEESKLTGSFIELKGQAFCVLPNEQTELPIVFEAKFNSNNQAVSDLSYKFVKGSENSYAPSSNEEVLMKELMKKISVDYKTDHITIAIDNFETLKMDDNLTGFKGIGEVKIGQSIWNKIDFNVVLKDNKKASQIKYEIKK